MEHEPDTPLQKEQRVREMLESFFGMTFEKKTLPLLARRADGSPIFREFDAVSEDGKVIAEIKSDKHTDKAFLNTRFPRSILACRYLELCSAETRTMIFTDREFFRNFKAAADGLLQGNIQVIWADLQSGEFVTT